MGAVGGGEIEGMDVFIELVSETLVLHAQSRNSRINILNLTEVCEGINRPFVTDGVIFLMIE